MKPIFFLTLVFLICFDSLSQNHLQNENILHIRKENIIGVQIRKWDIKMLLDSNFVKLHENEDIVEKYHYVKFDFFPKNIYLKNCLEALLLPRIEVTTQKNILNSDYSIYVRIRHYSTIRHSESNKIYKNAASFKRSIRKNFPEEMIIEE